MVRIGILKSNCENHIVCRHENELIETCLRPILINKIERVKLMGKLGSKPTVFISSTCYDLKQLRADLCKIIENEIGFEVLLSEYASFPLDPSLGTVDNCLRVVKERADIFILVVGARYGYRNESGKSVTNLEYLSAREVFQSMRLLTKK